MSSEQNLYKTPRIGVGVAVVREGQVLLGKRKGAHGAGEWSFPGGHLEYLESVEACAAPELLEEMGLTALSLKLGPWTEDVMEKDKHYITIFVFADRFEGEVKLLEPHKCEGWFDWDDLPSPLFPSIHSLLAKVGIEYLKNISTQLSPQEIS